MFDINDLVTDLNSPVSFCGGGGGGEGDGPSDSFCKSLDQSQNNLSNISLASGVVGLAATAGIVSAPVGAVAGIVSVSSAAISAGVGSFADHAGCGP